MILINDLFVADGINVTKNNGVADISLNIDDTLQFTSKGKLSVVAHLPLQSDLEMKVQAPMKLTLHSDVTPGDPIGSTMLLDYDREDFNVTDSGKLKTNDLNLVGKGNLSIRKADLSLGELDSKMRVISIDTSDDFTQVGGKLQIKGEGAGRIPSYQIGTGFASNANFTYDGATTLSVDFIKVTESFTVPDNYIPSVAYMVQAYQAGELTGLEIDPALNSRRIIHARTNPFSMRIKPANQLEVNTGNTMKQDADGVDVKHDLSIKEEVFGIGVNLSESSPGLHLNADG
ncbi:hypothetical protein HDV00_000874 [Rhizophlyctis rosea]|nr:hypothetical protein HDV00_000874 [Rhizophlyctis rosea]